ncbi:MAG TPA: hypothetical protein VMP08_12175 [Anaerolineae bacterium]|nr:hypothetical protein [Anaerolineae bacterium]
MDSLALALGPAFAAGFAVQRLLEILDPLLDKVSFVKDNKKMVLAIVSLIVGFALAIGAGLRVLRPLGVTSTDLVDIVITALIVSAGTEGFNSIMKFLGYAKEGKKADTAGKTPDDTAVKDLQRTV